LVLATRNAGKIAEYHALLADLDVDLLTLNEFSGAPTVAEDAPTYRANAVAKARAIAAFTELPALADDSGLEVDALGGAPGVRSARYAGEGARDRDNVAKLLAALSDVVEALRGARFRCVIAVARPDGAVLIGEGTCAGRIAAASRGDCGFGYDPVFVLPELGRTFAELSAAEKHARSHRGRALAAVRARLLEFLKA
jgi:XTP/dITP diphosphohydrolase